MRVKRRGTWAGQTLVEFALVAPVFFTIFFGIIEMGRVMNAWVTLNDICLDAASWSSRPDPTMTRGPYEVFSYMAGQLRTAKWVTNLRDDSRTCQVTVDVNDPGADANSFETRVRIQMALKPLVGPNPQNIGIPLYDIDVEAEVENISRSLGGSNSNVRLNVSGITATPWTAVTTSVADLLANY